MTYTRNTDPFFWNTNRKSCNCGSFALNVTSWFCPYDNDDEYTDKYRSSLIQEMFDEGFSKESIIDNILELDQEAILKACPWLEPVLLEETSIEDRVVSYRLYLDDDDFFGNIDDDYHFRVRINGFWFEKCGEDPIRFLGTAADEEPWQVSHYLIYDSDVKYFRFKN